VVTYHSAVQNRPCERPRAPAWSKFEYIIARSITRTRVISVADWNKNWHDHKQEIATGRVQVLDLPPDKAKRVADLAATTDEIIFHLWLPDDKVSRVAK